MHAAFWLTLTIAQMAEAPAVVTPAPEEIAPGVALLRGAMLGERGPDGNTVIFSAPEGLIVVDTGRHVWHSDAILAYAKAQVTVLEMLPRMGNDIDLWNRWVILDRMAASAIQMQPNTQGVEITEKGVAAMTQSKPRFFPCDTVVLAVGAKEDNALGLALEGKIPGFYKVGDCLKPQKVKQAVEDGFSAGLEI